MPFISFPIFSQLILFGGGSRPPCPLGRNSYAEVYPDRSKKVRNVGVRLKPRQSGTVDYVLTSSIVVKRHVSNLIVLVPAEERGENFHFHEEEVI